MPLPRRPDPLPADPTATHPDPTSTTTPPSATHGFATHRVVGPGLAIVGAVAVMGLLGPVAPLAAGSASPAAETASDIDESAVVEDADVDEMHAVRFTTSIEHRVTAIPAPEERIDDDTLPIGDTRIDQVGADGIRQETIEVTLRNGDVVQEQITEVLETAPTPTIISVGTATSDAATKDWAALAQCESGGDPTIVSSSGRYHGLYQFDLSTWRSVGGTGLPSEAPPDEQTRRAMTLYDDRGASPWPTCGRHL